MKTYLPNTTRFYSAVFLFLLTCSAFSKVIGQDCVDQLFRANKLLDAGRINECVALARPCSHSANEAAVRWQACRLMSISFLLNGQSDSARIYAENMLEVNPTYKTDPLKDPREFISLIQNIVVLPRFTIGLAFSAGSNITLPTVISSYVVADYQKTYTGRNTIQFGTNIGLYLHPRVKLDFGLLATTKAYRINYEMPDWKINVSEKLTYIDLPVSARYFLTPKKRFRVYLNGGVYGGYLLYAQNDFESVYNPTEEAFSLKKLNSLDRRNRFNIGILGGIGADYKIKTGQLSFEATFYNSFSNITRSETRYLYKDQIFNYFYIDDDFRLNNFTFNLGYSFPLNYRVYKTTTPKI